MGKRKAAAKRKKKIIRLTFYKWLFNYADYPLLIPCSFAFDLNDLLGMFVEEKEKKRNKNKSREEEN